MMIIWAEIVGRSRTCRKKFGRGREGMTHQRYLPDFDDPRITRRLAWIRKHFWH
jgi:hypothetical protein